jgi:hypothetical protein
MTTQEAQTFINNWKGSKDDPKYLEAKDFLENKQSSTQDMKKDIKDMNTPKKEPKKHGVLKTLEEIGGAISRNQAGAGGAAMSNSQPTIQQVKEDKQIIDEIAEATGLEKSKGLLKGGATDSKDVAQNLKDRGVAVTDEYKNKNPEVFNDFKVGKEASVKEEKEGAKGGNGGSGSTSSTFLDKNNAIANTQEDKEYERQKDGLFKRWDLRNANIDKMSDSMRNIDDKLIAQLPTFMFKRYQQGEFGDPKSSDAKLRLAYFAMNNVVSKLKQFANASAAARGQGTLFQNTESAYDQYQANNLQKGMENRWRKYEAETQGAIDIAKQGGMSEEAVTDSIATISSNNRLQSAFNMMNERQKVFALNVLSEVGDKLGNMNDEQFANTLMAMAYSGDSLDAKEAAGMLIYRFIKDPEKRDKALEELGFGKGGALLKGLTKD